MREPYRSCGKCFKDCPEREYPQGETLCRECREKGRVSLAVKRERDRDRNLSRARGCALSRLRELHREEFEALYQEELDLRGMKLRQIKKSADG